MPAGRGDEDYRLKLEAINWQDLYRRLDGYLLLEDLKTQWRRAYEPDYVFIDSRTGFTEVEGICTRQLPDAVVTLFFPNEENLGGLRQVVGDIRAEAVGPRKKQIQLHFVMSNVPDLDDEDEILNNRMKEFRIDLGYEELTATIHRYDSLALLDQVIFTHTRPKSRLAREYLVLKDAIVAANIEDREGAIHFLKDRLRPWGLEFGPTKEEFESRLATISKIHNADGEVLFLLAMVRKSEQRLEDALVFLDQAIACDSQNGRSLVVRAELHQDLQDASGAIADIKAALALPNLPLPVVEIAVRMLRKVAVNDLGEVSKSPAVKALAPEDRTSVTDMVTWNRGGLVASLEIATSIVTDPAASADVKRGAHVDQIFALIGLGRFVEAMDVSVSAYPRLEEMPLPFAFNYAMAEWGKTDEASRISFARAVDRQSEGEKTSRSLKANFHQCLAIAFWAVADISAAEYQLSMAEQTITEWKRPAPSCWRY